MTRYGVDPDDEQVVDSLEAKRADLAEAGKNLTNPVSHQAVSNRSCIQVACNHEDCVKASVKEPKGIVEQMLDVLVPEMVEQFVELLNAASQDRIQERTVEWIDGFPVPQVAEGLIEVFKALPQDRVQQRSVEPQLASRMSVIMKFDAGAGEDAFAKVKGFITELICPLQKQALEDDTVKHSSTLETAVSRSTKADPELVNEGHIDKICDQFSDVVLDACLTCGAKCKVACETCVKDNMFMVAGEITVAGKLHHETVVRGVAQRQAHMNRMVQKTIEIPQLRQTDQVIDVPVVLVVQVPWVRVVRARCCTSKLTLSLPI